MITSIQAIIYPMLSIGISKVFLPAYKRHMALEEDDKAARLADRMMTLLGLVTLVVIALLMLFSNVIVAIVAPGFDEQTKELCAELVTISAPMYLFIIFASTYSAMLQCHNRFLGSQIREVVSHIPPIIAAVFFYSRLGEVWGMRALALSLVAGAMLRILVELPFVNWKYRYKPDLSFRDDEFRVIVHRLPAALITAAIAQINHLVDKIMASGFEKGAVSALHYGSKLLHVFSGLLSTAVSTALYPQMVEMITHNKKKELSSIVAKIISIFCVLMIPVTLACVIFSKNLISVVYERGAFEEQSTALTAGAFAFYSLSLLFTAISSVVNNVFYGHGNTKTPMLISLYTITLNIALNYDLSYFMGVNGLALATSVTAIVGMIVNLVCVQSYITVPWKKLFMTLNKIMIASVFACFPAYFITLSVENKYLHLMLAAVIGIVLYLCALRVLKIRELK